MMVRSFVPTDDRQTTVAVKERRNGSRSRLAVTALQAGECTCTPIDVPGKLQVNSSGGETETRSGVVSLLPWLLDGDGDAPADRGKIGLFFSFLYLKKIQKYISNREIFKNGCLSPP